MQFKKIFFHSPVRYAVAFALAVIITLIRLFTTSFDLMIHYIDALTIAGALVFLIGMLQIVTRLGAFDIFGYSFTTFRTQSKYKDLVEYRRIKEEKRSRENLTYIPFILVGTGFLTVGFTLYSFI